MAFDQWLDRLHVFKANPILAWPLVLGNLAAVYYGWTDYYAYQFSTTPLWLWPLVSDSPNAVLLFAIAVILHQIRRPNRVVDLIAFIANVKVGIWTVFVLLYYFDQFFDRDPILRWALFWLHVGMVGQALALYRDLRMHPVKVGAASLVVAVFLLHDMIDYGWAVHPILPRAPDAVVVGVTVLITLVACGLAWTWFVRGGAKRTGLGSKT